MTSPRPGDRRPELGAVLREPMASATLLQAVREQMRAVRQREHRAPETTAVLIHERLPELAAQTIAEAAYLDECVDHDLVETLRARGFTATSAREQAQANRGVEDEAQLAFASSRDWVIVTYNERLFRALADIYQRRGQVHGGIIVLPGRPPFERVALRAAMMLDWLGTMPDH